MIINTLTWLLGKSGSKSTATKSMTMEQAFNMANNVPSDKLEVVFSCLRDKCETSGMIPLKLYDSSGLKKSGRAHRIFTKKPNDYMNMQTFIEMGTWWLERRGVFYAYKRKNENGSVYEIIPFRFQTNVTAQMDQNGNVYYLYTTNDGKPATPYAESDLFVIQGVTADGFTPMSPLEQAATLLGIYKSQEANYKDLQENGITAQMALGTDNVFKDNNALTRLQDDWKGYTGTQGRGKVPIFENGVKPLSLNLTPQEQELLTSREFSVNRICRLFRVPTHRVGVAEKADIVNVFDMDEAYFRNAIVPNLKRFEAELNDCLPSGLRVEFNYNSFYSGSPWRLAEAIDKMVKGGVKSVGEGREDLGLERVEGDDVFAIQNNNAVYGRWANLAEIQAQMQQNNQSNTSTTQGDDNDNEETQ